jgi:hypothetical protein
MSSRTCPACGAHNSELSIFCAECGTSLNNGSWEDEGQTQAFQPVASPPWATPASSERRTPSGTYSAVPASPDDDATRVETPSAFQAGPAGGSGAVVNSWESWDRQADRGARGFVLGTVAWLLILAVFGVYLWSAVLSSGLKSDIRDLVPGLSTILLHLG